MAVAMTELVAQRCEACRVGAPPATEAEIAEYSEQIPDWEIVGREGIPTLERAFRFGNFAAALEFTNRVGELAEEEGHHPRAADRVGARHGDLVDAQDPESACERLRHGGEDGPGVWGMTGGGPVSGA